MTSSPRRPCVNRCLRLRLLDSLPFHATMTIHSATEEQESSATPQSSAVSLFSAAQKAGRIRGRRRGRAAEDHHPREEMMVEMSPITEVSPHHHLSAVDALREQQHQSSQDFWQTFAGVAGNILEWYDFAIFGFLGDVIGEVFFPPQQGDAATIESFAVFGGAFLMRPVGGVLMGYIGDKFGRKKALVISIFLMAFPTFAMGCLPSYEKVGYLAIVLLLIVRLLQGLSVGGQLMSSLVYTLESHDQRKWGLYGSFVLAAANFGTLLGGVAGFILRAVLSHEQLVAWGWRIPFLSGIIVSFSGFYLRSHGGDHVPGHHGPPASTASEDDDEYVPTSTERNPIFLAFAKGNRRSLGAATLVPMLWSGGFYLSFVWMAIYMADLLSDPVPHAFAVNSLSLLVSVCLLFPLAGIISDHIGRRRTMTIGGVMMGIWSPFAIFLIGKGSAILAFFAQSLLGIALSLWGAPMCAWLVEAFEEEARLTSVAIGYNIAQATIGGSIPSVATLMVDYFGAESPGWILTFISVVSLIGLWLVAPPSHNHGTSSPTKAQFSVLDSHRKSSSYLEDGDETHRGDSFTDADVENEDHDDELL